MGRRGVWAALAGVPLTPQRAWRRCASHRRDPTLTPPSPPPPSAAEADTVQAAAVTPRREGQELLHAVKRALTTSARSRWNRTDIINAREYARAHRRRFQRTNDAFHSAGKRGQTLSYEAMTLQFQGVEWSYVLLPACLALLILVLMALVDGRRHTTKLQGEMETFQRRADFLSSMRTEVARGQEAAACTAEERGGAVLRTGSDRLH
ncbi:uncharacterized protein Tco025E_08743 [Trypanosoma conorhini]|uniref:Uncharacterized protein n=1 Tax=Trypanosoma conorhini TaxID=83891 RepID=A0A3R7M763_9TRYP|nr:uncharacterized protein Tco025E_08743 [Trypanosoma conorhini]RNF00709.1 hypothetical protein Tco025E_08743 [Trypanosoma conorhini]